jgi:hypothetical protein
MTPYMCIVQDTLHTDEETPHSQFIFHLLTNKHSKIKIIPEQRKQALSCIVGKCSLVLVCFRTCFSTCISTILGRLFCQFPDGLLRLKIREVCLESFSVFPVLKGCNTSIGWKLVLPSCPFASHCT